jgi:hypothetical protein
VAASRPGPRRTVPASSAAAERHCAAQFSARLECGLGREFGYPAGADSGRPRLAGLADTAELVVSEIITNAVRAATPIARQQHETVQLARAQLLRFWLTSDRRSVLIQVWDSDHHRPVRKDAGPDAEAGRGLQLIEALSTQWGCYAPDGQGGKIVWAVCA